MFDSEFLYEHLRAAVGMCRFPYYNLTACQLLGNMCVMILYTLDNNRLMATTDACSHYLTLLNEEFDVIGLKEW